VGSGLVLTPLTFAVFAWCKVSNGLPAFLSLPRSPFSLTSAGTNKRSIFQKSASRAEGVGINM
jgi:hypothetical protein